MSNHDKAVNIMQLVGDLENKIREKNDEIKEWKGKYWAVLRKEVYGQIVGSNVFWLGASFGLVIGVVLACIIKRGI